MKLYRKAISEQDALYVSAVRQTCSDPIIRRRYDVLWLRSRGFTIRQSAHFLDISEGTVRNILELYFDGGLTAIQHREPYRPQSSLWPLRFQILALFKVQIPHTIVDATTSINKAFGLSLSHDAIRAFLIRLGYRPLKTGVRPRQGDPEEQAEFLKKTRTRAKRSRTRQPRSVVC